MENILSPGKWTGHETVSLGGYHAATHQTVGYLWSCLVSGTAHSEVVKVEVTARADVLSGREFGLAGGYEKVAGKIYFAVYPRNPANRIITDIDTALTFGASLGNRRPTPFCEAGPFAVSGSTRRFRRRRGACYRSMAKLTRPAHRCTHLDMGQVRLVHLAV